MFPDSKAARHMTMSRTKASYCVTDGLGDLMAKDLCKEVRASSAGYTLLFDETTTNQERKQMDILIRFYSEAVKLVVTKYVTSFFFGHAVGEDLCKYFTDLILSDKFDLPWKQLVNTSSDGPNINKKVHRLLNEKPKHD